MCWAAERRVAPSVVRTTSGDGSRPPDMYWTFAAWLTIWSMTRHHEVAEHDVDDRPHPGHRRADGDARDPRLGDRRVDAPDSGPNSSTRPDSDLERRRRPRRRPRRARTRSGRGAAPRASASLTAWPSEAHASSSAAVALRVDIVGVLLTHTRPPRPRSARGTAPRVRARRPWPPRPRPRRRSARARRRFEPLLAEPARVERRSGRARPSRRSSSSWVRYTPVDVADLVSEEAIRVREEERRAGARSRARDRLHRGRVNRAHVLPVDVVAGIPNGAWSRPISPAVVSDMWVYSLYRLFSQT